ncbi:hypothetical protein IAD21_04263 [Abditibacteriota bacterium]|nr:hypothetical protein IAD21_04263 [Abditibacteriota bacterium]
MANSKLTPASFVEVVRQTATAFGEDRVSRHAAALAYFTVFSLSPLIVVLISVAAIYFGDAAKAGDAIKHQIENNVGTVPAEAIQDMIKNATANGSDASRPIVATIIALGVALWGASGLFGALQDSLNGIWGVMPKPDLGIMGVVRARFISFAMVLGVGFLLLVSLVLSTVIAAIAGAASGVMGDSAIIASVLNVVLGVFVSTLLFAAIYKVLPDAEIQWRDVWLGGFVTAVLFSLGRWLLGIYLGRMGASSTYGSAGALVVLLLWINYAATILFAGAEFTKAYANKLGSKILPSSHALAFTTETVVTTHAGKAGPAQATPDSLAKAGGKGTSSKDGKGEVVKAKPPLSPEKQAELAKSRRLDFEYTLSVVAGAAMVVVWVLRKRAREDAE